MAYWEVTNSYVCYFDARHLYLHLNIRDVFIHLVFIVSYKDPFLKFFFVGFMSLSTQEDGEP
jgi:hypothetical protein